MLTVCCAVLCAVSSDTDTSSDEDEGSEEAEEGSRMTMQFGQDADSAAVQQDSRLLQPPFGHEVVHKEVE